MSTAVQTQQIATSSTSGSPIALAYGFVWATGKPLAKYMLQNTGDSSLDYTRLGGWALGLGEWDGLVQLWVNDQLCGNSADEGTSAQTSWRWQIAQPSNFHFHSGCDAVIGSGLTPSSSGPDQGVDSFWSSFPPAVNPLAYNRIAYYMLKGKVPILGSSLSQGDATQWTDIVPIGLWRSQLVRIFDDMGNQTGYAFTTNPAWHFVDAILKRKIKPDYNIGLGVGPDALTSAEQARFDWGSIFESAQYFDQFLANGRRRFTGNYLFQSTTSLAAILEQMLLTCRSYTQEYAGKIYLCCDKPRASVFTFRREHSITLQPNDKSLHTAPNRLVGKFRDLMVPAAATIASIAASTLGISGPLVTTVDPHPFVAGDNIVIGGQGAPWDGKWVVLWTPPLAHPTDPPPTTLILTPKGSNYPATAAGGGLIGLEYSRFKERHPEFPHKRNQLARGAIGVGIPRQRNSIRQEYDLGVCSWDQASRVMQYERDRLLGPDADPYITPPRLVLRAPYFAKDAAGNLASLIRPGARITIDSTASVPYAGDYEVLPMTVRPCTAQASGSGATLALVAAADGGELEMELQEYSESYMYDSSDATQAGWVDVPGSDPSDDSGATFVPAVVGPFVFFSGALASGSSFSLPSSGYNPANVLAWASPQGYVAHPGEGFGGLVPVYMNGVELCSVAAQRCTLQYEQYVAGSYGHPGIEAWGGDVNFAALAWQSGASVSVQTVGAITYVVITLANGEKICFGQGVVADGASFSLPTGFTTDKMFSWSSPYDMQGDLPMGSTQGNAAASSAWNAASFATWIDGTPPTTVHMEYYPSPGQSGFLGSTPPTSWPGRAQVLIFAWQNNSGAVTVTGVTGGSYMAVPVNSSVTFGVGLIRLSDGQTLPSPSGVASGTVLQTIPSPRSVAALTAPTGGVKSCYLDGSNKLSMTWDGAAGDAMVLIVFAGAPA